MQLMLKVKPNSKIDEIIRGADGLLKVKIKAPATEGKANQYLVAYLAEVLGLPKSKITLLKGAGSRYKTVEIDADEGAVLRKLKP
jgi:uncharacterized protein